MTDNIKISPVDYSGTDTTNPDILLDAPDGHWLAQCHLKPRASKPKPDDAKEYPMLELKFKLLQDLVGGSEQYVSRNVTDYIVLYPPGHKNFQMMMRKLHGLCACADVPIPRFERLEQWPADAQDFIDSIDRAQFNIWTAVESDRRTQEKRTQVKYEAPRRF